MTADDFFTGLLAALALRNYQTVSIRNGRLDRALAQVFLELERWTEQQGIDVDFRIRVHPVHGDSKTARGAVIRAVQRGLVGFDSPELQDVRLRIEPAEARVVLGRLAGGRLLYDALADVFLRCYDVAVA